MADYANAFSGLKHAVEVFCERGELVKAEQAIDTMKWMLEQQKSTASLPFIDNAYAMIGASAVTLILANAKAGNTTNVTRIIQEMRATCDSKGSPVIDVAAITKILAII